MSRFLQRRIQAFAWAGRGVWLLLRTQTHARIHLLATVVVMMAGCWFQVTSTEWCFLTIAIGLVWITEAVNTAIENSVDLVTTEHHPLAGQAKDIAAGAVLLAAITAVVIAALIFGPKLLPLLTESQQQKQVRNHSWRSAVRMPGPAIAGGQASSSS